MSLQAHPTQASDLEGYCIPALTQGAILKWGRLNLIKAIESQRRYPLGRLIKYGELDHELGVVKKITTEKGLMLIEFYVIYSREENKLTTLKIAPDNLEGYEFNKEEPRYAGMMDENDIEKAGGLLSEVLKEGAIKSGPSDDENDPEAILKWFNSTAA